MPKCSGPTAWTRGVSRPVGFCRTKSLRALAGGVVRGRGIGRSFRVEKVNPQPKRQGRGQEKRFFSQLTPIPRGFVARGAKNAAADGRRGPPIGLIGVRPDPSAA